MAKLKRRATRKGVKLTAKHMVRGTASKARRAPFRSGSLLGVGALARRRVGWVAGRGRARRRLRSRRQLIPKTTRRRRSSNDDRTHAVVAVFFDLASSVSTLRSAGSSGANSARGQSRLASTELSSAQ